MDSHAALGSMTSHGETVFLFRLSASRLDGTCLCTRSDAAAACALSATDDEGRRWSRRECAVPDPEQDGSTWYSTHLSSVENNMPAWPPQLDMQSSKRQTADAKQVNPLSISCSALVRYAVGLQGVHTVQHPCRHMTGSDTWNAHASSCAYAQACWSLANAACTPDLVKRASSMDKARKSAHAATTV